jgi:hypothetical protein
MKYGIKNFKVWAASLCLGCTLMVTGCADENTITLGTKNNECKITYEDETTTDIIPLYKLDDSVKILKLEVNNNEVYKLVGKWTDSSSTKYYDLETGKRIIFKDTNGNIVNVVSEYSIRPYLESHDNLLLWQNVNDLVDFYNESVLQDLKNGDSEKMYGKEN